jgi:TPR repeat protein
MGGLFRMALDWVLDKLGVRDAWSWDDFRSLSRTWEESQCNAKGVYENDRHAAAAEEARALAQVDPAAGFSWMLRLAEQGSVWAMGLVAYYYQFGVGVAADEAKSEDWHRRAFEGGSQRAQLNYGFRLMRRGAWREAEDVFRVGVVDDWAPALHWFAKVRLNQFGARRAFAEVLPLLERGSAKGSLDCELCVAVGLLRGRGGFRRIAEGFRRCCAVVDVITKRIAEQKARRGSPKPGAPTLH